MPVDQGQLPKAMSKCTPRSHELRSSARNKCVPEPIQTSLDNHEPGRVPHYLVIDGQQRLMTSTIILGALRDEARQGGDEDLAGEIHEDYLLRARKKRLERYKVVPRLRDRQCLLTLAEGDEPPPDASRIGKAYGFFRQQIRAAVNAAGNGHLREMFTVISSRLAFVTITLRDD